MPSLSTDLTLMFPCSSVNFWRVMLIFLVMVLVPLPVILLQSPYPLWTDCLIYDVYHHIVKFPAIVSNRCKGDKDCKVKFCCKCCNVGLCVVNCFGSLLTSLVKTFLSSAFNCAHHLHLRCYFGLKHTFLSYTLNLYSIRYLPIAY